jgi:NADH:ubiquinone oxidoreductase subunit 4 (subunit M)
MTLDSVLSPMAVANLAKPQGGHPGGGANAKNQRGKCDAILDGVWVLGTLATLFWCIVMAPIILVIGFAGKFWLVWNAIAAHPGWACLATVALVATAMLWIWLLIIVSYGLAKRV